MTKLKAAQLKQQVTEKNEDKEKLD